jgi:hypothetical protein
MNAKVKQKAAQPKALYKVLVDGCAIHGNLTWSLPTEAGPGDWHEVEGDLVRCRNGLHLTDDPSHRWQDGAECYVVETDGPVLHEADWGDEYVARRVRLVRRLSWAELAAFGVQPDRDSEPVVKPTKKGRVAQPPPPPKGPSPAMQLVRRAWENRCEATAHSWRTVNNTMYEALKLAITGGMSFAVGDVAEIYRSMRGSYWFGESGEGLYSIACDAGNLQASQSFEAWRGRKPFMWEGKRLSVGSQFVWEGLLVRVTSFQDDAGALTACSYKPNTEGVRWHRGAIDRRFSITREALAKAEKDRKTEAKITADATAVQKVLVDDCDLRVDLRTVVSWTPEEREAAAEWARVAKHDVGKTRVKMPEPPAFLADALAKAQERERAEKIESLMRRIRSLREEKKRADDSIAWTEKELAKLRGETQTTEEAA